MGEKGPCKERCAKCCSNCVDTIIHCKCNCECTKYCWKNFGLYVLWLFCLYSFLIVFTYLLLLAIEEDSDKTLIAQFAIWLFSLCVIGALLIAGHKLKWDKSQFDIEEEQEKLQEEKQAEKHKKSHT